MTSKSHIALQRLATQLDAVSDLKTIETALQVVLFVAAGLLLMPLLFLLSPKETAELPARRWDK